MVPLKGKSTSRLQKDSEVVCPSKKAPASKFKIYSEYGKPAANRRATAGPSISRKCIPQKHATNETGHKGPVSERKGTLDTLVKTNVPRRALADLSNAQGTLSGNAGHGSSKLRYTMTLVRRASSTSSGHILSAKGKTKENLDVDGVCSFIKGDTKLGRVSTSSRLQKFVGQPCSSVNDRLAAKKSVQVTRKSIVRTTSQVPATKIKENAASVYSSRSTYGFRVKDRFGGTEISRAGDAKNKFRLTDKSGVKASKGLTCVDSCRRPEKSIKESMNIGLRASNAEEAIRPLSYRMDKSQSSLSSKRDGEEASSVAEGTSSLISHEEAAQDELAKNSNENAKKLNVNTQKKSSRRRSYTSLLISKSKLQENNEIEQQEPNIDDQGNPLEVADYVDEIYQYYWMMEAQGMVVPNYMTNQTEATAQMRAILVNWLVEVHYKFDLMPETLYLTIGLLDRYLSVVTIKKNEMQLVGLTSLLLASKYEDFWHPRVKDLISISAESYTRRQMLQMEKDLLTKLKFRFNLPTAYVFMLRFLKASRADTKLEHLAFYLIELSLVEYEALKFKPSLLCAGAVYVTRCTLQLTPTWTPLLSSHARYLASETRECAKMILGFHKAASAGQLKVIHEKYSKSEFSKVAAIKPLDTLPH